MAVMMVDNPLGDSQSQTGAAGFPGPRLIRTVKTVKDTGDIGRGNPDPIILHQDLDGIVLGFPL